MYIRRKNYTRWVSLLYWNEHYAPISNIDRLFADISKHQGRIFFCIRCLGHLTTPEILARHQKLCSRKDFMSVDHVLPQPGSGESNI